MRALANQQHALRCLFVVSLIAALAAFGGRPARADIDGFGDFSHFTINHQADSSAAPVLNLAAHSIRLTTQAGAPESRSIFFNTPQAISAFTASFTYQALGSIVPVNEFDSFGACFVMQNSSTGLLTVLTPGPYGTTPNRFGYGPPSPNAFVPPVFDHSVALSLERGARPAGPPFSGFTPTSATGLYNGGLISGGATDTAPLDILSGHPINVTLTYNGSILSETLVDSVTSASFSQAFQVNIPALVGDSTAYVGFSASTVYDSDQASLFSNFQFHATPEPASLTLAILGTVVTAMIAGLGRRRYRRRTVAAPQQTRVDD